MGDDVVPFAGGQEVLQVRRVGEAVAYMVRRHPGTQSADGETHHAAHTSSHKNISLQ